MGIVVLKAIARRPKTTNMTVVIIFLQYILTEILSVFKQFKRLSTEL